jgi:MoaA/NifB/PqqE/SkfB family radical SAM enzyme
LTCVGCYAGNYNKEEDLSYELVDRILNEAKDLGIYFITVSGGEPFMWPHLLDIFEKHHDMFFQIYTNGTMITKEIANRLGKLGNAAPAISIEGFEKETDLRRGEGTFKKIMEAMDNLYEAGVPFGFSATPTKNNIDILMSDEFIDLMIDKGCLLGWYFQYVPIGRRPDVSLMATPEQRFELRKRSIEIRNTKPIFIGDFWNDGPYVGGCICGARQAGYFHINCRGDVEPCVFLQFSVDNIKDKKLIDVIQSPFFKAFQEAQPYRENNNLLTPCALIDNPHILRDIVTKYNAKPSYNSCMDVINNPEITSFLDNYSKEYQKLVDPIWENELKLKYKTWKERWIHD